LLAREAGEVKSVVELTGGTFMYEYLTVVRVNTLLLRNEDYNLRLANMY
jgi:hypothetical protein